LTDARIATANEVTNAIIPTTKIANTLRASTNGRRLGRSTDAVKPSSPSPATPVKASASSVTTAL
jgi:hypothetical protein